MQTQDTQEKPTHPLLRVTTFGDFSLARSVPTNSERPRYSALSWDDVGTRKAALVMLKILLCSPRRRATKSTLIEMMWPSRESSKSNHALDIAASALRRNILSLPSNPSLLQTQRINGDTLFTLPAQAWIWVDADAVLKLSSTAIRRTEQGENPLPYLETAHNLAKGEFLEDDYECAWSQSRRQTISGAQRRILYQLVDLYLQTQQRQRAEEMLYTFLQDHPGDNDALCRLIVLLAEQGRRQEALTIYNYSTEIMRETESPESRETIQQGPTVYAQELARRIQQGLAVREQRAVYSSGYSAEYTVVNANDTNSLASTCSTMYRASIADIRNILTLCPTI